VGATLHVRPEPLRRPAPTPRPPERAPLSVVPPRRRLRTGRTVLLGGLLAFVIAFGLVVAQALLVQGQQRLDDLDGMNADAARRQRELRLQIAELESPDRIVAAATDLGMVPPPGVTYLTPSGLVTAPERPLTSGAQ
jgi:cell division protein FtsL